VVELELFERRKRAIPGLEKLELCALVGVEFVEHIRLRIGLTEERQGDDDHAPDDERRHQHERDRQRVAGRPTCAVRATSLFCSRPSGQSAISEPRRNTTPAIQMRLTSGFTNTRK